MEAMLRGVGQAPGPDGWRRTRGGIIRNTFGELKSTTIPTWLEWFPEEVFGRLVDDSPIHQTLAFDPGDGKGPVEIQAWFFPLDQEKDVKKLKSLELTWAWINEACEITEDAFKMVRKRVNRYPRKVVDLATNQRLFGPTYPGVWMDTNPPDPDNWYFRMAEEAKPDNWEFFSQPPALIPVAHGPIKSLEGNYFKVNPAAENLPYVGEEYYIDSFNAETEDQIRVYGEGKYGFIKSGQVVFKTYSDKDHYTDDDLPAIIGEPLLVGMDFGPNTACVLAQYHKPSGCLRLIDELAAQNCSLEDFLPGFLIPHLAMYYPGMRLHGWGDPSGNSPGFRSKKTCFQLLNDEYHFNIIPAPLPVNDFLSRKMAVDRILGRRNGVLIGPRCVKLHAGFLGKYRYAPRRTLGSDGQLKDMPEKSHPYSDLQDAFQYLVLGVGGSVSVPSMDIDALVAQAAKGEWGNPYVTG